MERSDYEQPNSEDIEIFWENPQLKVVALSTQKKTATIFLSTAFENSEMGALVENPNLLDKEGDYNNLPPITPVSERPNRPPALLRSCPFRTRIQNVSDFVYRSFFQ